jgi:hypothetical protein
MRGREVTVDMPLRGGQDGSDRVRMGDSVADDDDDATKPSREILRKLQRMVTCLVACHQKHPMGPLERSTLPRRWRLILLI